MACVRKRRGKYVVDWRDGAGVRHWKSFDRKGEAEAWQDKVRPEARQRLRPVVSATITLRDYVDHWKILIASAVKPRTLARYTEILTLHLLPHFGAARVRELDRGRIKLFLAEKRNAGLEKRTVQNLQSVLRTILNHAIEDQLIVANPAAKLGKALKLTVSKATKQESIKAMTPEQRQLFLATARRDAPRYAPLFFVLAGTGMRLGEGLALQPGDVDLSTKTIRIARAFSEDGSLGTPKSGHGRTVDLSQSLTDALGAHETTHARETLQYGWTGLPPWCFVTKEGTPMDPANVRRAMQRVLKAAALPLHFTPHGLRHSYASILLADGVSPVYVQEQLGHATIELTVSTYGRWLKKKAPGALDRLDSVTVTPSGSKTVAAAAFAGRPVGATSARSLSNQALDVELARGIEPLTCGLLVRCGSKSLERVSS